MRVRARLKPRLKKTRRIEVHGDAITVETKQDVTDVAEMAHHLSTIVKPGFMGDGAGAMGHLVASIPRMVYFAIPEHIRNDEKLFSAWLNDPANRVWRIKPGRV